MANSDREERLRVSQAEIEQMIAAAAIIRDCRRDLAARNTDVVGEVIGSSTICAWRHYPDGEVFDATSHAQYFFHAHALDGRQSSERGHFHTFLRAEGMPSGVVPLLLPELAVADVAALPPQAAPLKRGERDEVSHLIAIAIDVRGEPIRLFTTNRWVTGETWYRAEDVARMLDRFVIAEREPSVVLNRWIGAMIHLFRPQIAALLHARDGTVMARRRRRRTHVFEDPRLEITSSLDIQLDTQLALVDRARDRSDEGAVRRVFALPPMAEGWEEGHAG
ncbi:MAG: hypothetical protein JOZ11_19595 [Alphaproteobacteria bacterium]|nr:hypothetical protein [Alphaproteobacteria bacterium]